MEAQFLCNLYHFNAQDISLIDTITEIPIESHTTVSEGKDRVDRTLLAILNYEKHITSPEDLEFCSAAARQALIGSRNPFADVRTFLAALSSPNIVAGEVLECECRKILRGTEAVLDARSNAERTPFASFEHLGTTKTQIVRAGSKRRTDDVDNSAKKRLRRATAAATTTSTSLVPLRSRIGPVPEFPCTFVGRKKKKMVFRLYRPRRHRSPRGVVATASKEFVATSRVPSPADKVYNEFSFPIFDTPPPRLYAVPTIAIVTAPAL